MVNYVNFIWNIAESLRGPFKPSEYGSVVLPFTVLRRLDAVLTDTKAAVLKVAPTVATAPEVLRTMKLTEVSGHQFYNTSPFDFAKLVADPADLRANLSSYLAGFSPNVRDIFERFEFDKTLNKLAEKNKLFSVTEKFAQADFHPRTVSNIQMGLVFEELIRFANEKSNETAGDHYTPREVIALMVQLLFALDDDALSKSGVVRSIYDPTAGTGGMLSVADEYLRKMNPGIQLSLYGQDYNDASYAICKADMVIKGQDVDNIALGDTLTEDAFDDKKFDYGLSNPPFGVDWKDQRGYVEDEHTKLGFNGRFGPGTPTVSDGAMLFLLHLVSKMRKPEDGGSRMAIVLNGSPLFSGGAGGGESNIRKWLLDNDLVEAIIGLPTDIFYNTGISTFIWVLSNRKTEDRKGLVQLIDGREMFSRLRRPRGSKRNELGPENIETIVRLYAEFEEDVHSKVFRNEDFLYRVITVERPLRLSWRASPERIESAFKTKAVHQLGESESLALRRALESLATAIDLPIGDREQSSAVLPVWTDRKLFHQALSTAAKAENLALTPSLLRAVTTALGERDEAGGVCRDAKGHPEPDATLRDTETVPWSEDIHEFAEREVFPFSSESWIDDSRTKEGAEIPFTRIFYSHDLPRDLPSMATIVDGLGDLKRRVEKLLAASAESISSDRVGSGQAWIGDVPGHWRVEPLGRWFDERKSTVSDTDYPPLSVTMGGVVPQLDHVAKTEDNSNRKLVRKGDIAINSRSDRKGSSGLAPCDGSVSVITTVMEPRGIHPRFAHHLIRSRPFQEEFYRWGHGIVADLWSTKWTEMKGIRIPIPPKPEQVQIADHLDNLNDLVAQAEALVSSLKFQRAAIVGAAVTGKVHFVGESSE